jgi:Mg-chelatase subunit ChlD
MTEKDNKLAPFKKPQPSKQPNFRLGPKPVGLAAAQVAAKNKPELAKKEEFKPIDMKDATNKIGIVFDDSGSMSGQPILDAHAACEEFVKNCNPTNTALSVYPMNADTSYTGSIQTIKLTTDLIAVIKAVKQIRATGGTPLYETLLEMLEKEELTRGIVFSDGAPQRTNEVKEEAFRIAKEKKIPVDSVYIGEDDKNAIELMKEIAERTGGVFLHFKPGKANFRTAFKYLTPGLRAMLMDKSFVEKLQKGEVS